PEKSGERPKKQSNFSTASERIIISFWTFGLHAVDGVSTPIAARQYSASPHLRSFCWRKAWPIRKAPTACDLSMASHERDIIEEIVRTA
ncbi:MAG: hypothetical protein Q9187_007006, partial [Circinaria calcarea]